MLYVVSLQTKTKVSPVLTKFVKFIKYQQTCSCRVTAVSLEEWFSAEMHSANQRLLYRCRLSE